MQISDAPKTPHGLAVDAIEAVLQEESHRKVYLSLEGQARKDQWRVWRRAFSQRRNATHALLAALEGDETAFNSAMREVGASEPELSKAFASAKLGPLEFIESDTERIKTAL